MALRWPVASVPALAHPTLTQIPVVCFGSVFPAPLPTISNFVFVLWCRHEKRLASDYFNVTFIITSMCQHQPVGPLSRHPHRSDKDARCYPWWIKLCQLVEQPWGRPWPTTVFRSLEILVAIMMIRHLNAKATRLRLSRPTTRI